MNTGLGLSNIGSLFAKKGNKFSTNDEGIAEPVKEGDIIFISPESGLFYLHGDGITGSAGFQSFMEGQEPQNFQDCLWRILPQLSHVQSKQLRKLRKASSANEKEFKLMQERADSEQINNDNLIKRVIEGGLGQMVTYGQVVHLMHLKTRKFLTASKINATVDRDAFRLSLEDKSTPKALFIIRPSIKVRSEGGQVYFSDAITLESKKLADYRIHASSHPMPNCDTDPKLHEANLLPHAPPLRLHSWARYDRRSLGRLRAALPVRLYHHEAESFVQASSNHKKQLGSSGRHAPYLKRVLGGNYESMTAFCGKGAWAFEYPTRTQGGEFLWGELVRLRHVPSGKYLAVDYHAAPAAAAVGSPRAGRRGAAGHFTGGAAAGAEGAEASGSEEAKSGMGLPEPMQDADEALYFPALLVEDHKVEPGQMLFVIDKLDDAPAAEVALGANLHLAHPVSARAPGAARALAAAADDGGGGGGQLYLTWTARPKKTGRPGSTQLAFAGVRKDKDAIQLLEIDMEHIQDMDSLLSYRAVAEGYPRRLQQAFGGAHGTLLSFHHHHREQAAYDPAAEAAMLCGLIMKIIVGQQDEEDTAETIQGPSDRFQQNFGRDTKLMDALVAMIHAPLACGLSLEYRESQKQFADPRFAAVAGVHRLACKALMHLFLNNPGSEEYFARQTLKAGSERIEWISLLIQQVPYPVGAAECLTALISNNATLLEKSVDEKTVKFFQKLIQDQGPYASYLRYFVGICSCRGAQILSNQELVHKTIYCHAENRKALLLEHLTLQGESPVQEWESRSDQQYREQHGGEPDHGSFLGKAQHGAGFPQVYVHWSGNAEWRAGSSDLFYSPEALGIAPRTERIRVRRESLGHKDEREAVEEVVALVKLEDLCWVLDPQRLMEKVTGNEYDPDLFDWDTEDEIPDELLSKKDQIIQQKREFENKKQLALYLEAQIDLFSEMCLDRSYNVIGMLRETYPYEMLVGLVANSRLPDQLRASYLGLLQRLWLDVFPHEPNVGRHQFPDLLWVFPALRRRGVRDPGALPAFRLPPGHPLHARNYAGPPELKAFLTFPDANKFHLVEDFLSDFFIDLRGCQVYADREKNIFTLAVLRALRDLLSFGFYGTYEEVKDVCNPMISVLDGRQDCRRLLASSDGLADQVARAAAGFVRGEDRYKLDEDSALVMACKQSICATLLQVGRLQSNYAVGQFLLEFKEHFEFPEKAVNAFQSLFEKEDLVALDLDQLSDAPLDTVLLDLLMYESDDLFQSTLCLLEARHTQRKSLLEYLKKVTLVCQEELPIYGSFEKLDLEISILRNYMQSSETWGVANEFSDLDKSVFEEVHLSMDKITRFLLMDEDSSDDIQAGDNGELGGDTLKRQPTGGTSDFVAALPPIPPTKRQDASRSASISHSRKNSYSVRGDSARGKILRSMRGSAFFKRLSITNEIEEEDSWEIKIKMQVNSYNQDLLFQLGLHSVLLGAIENDPPSGGRASPDAPHLWDVVYEALRCLTLLVKRHPAAQEATFGALPRFQRLLRRGQGGQTDPRVSEALVALIVETVRGNLELCERVGISLYHDFAQELARGRCVGVLDFFKAQITPENEVIKKNQNLVLSVLLAQREKVLDIDLDELVTITSQKRSILGQEATVEYLVALLDVFCECAKAQNASAIGKLQKELGNGFVQKALRSLLLDPNAASEGFFERLNKPGHGMSLDINPAALDPPYRNLLKSLVHYLDIVFFDTSLQDPEMATSENMHQIIVWLASLLLRLNLREQCLKDCQLGQVVLSCLKSYLCRVQNSQKLQTTLKEVYDRISKPMRNILTNTEIMYQLRSIAYDALTRAKVEKLDPSLAKTFEMETTEGFFPGDLEQSQNGAAALSQEGKHHSKRAELGNHLRMWLRKVEEDEDVDQSFQKERMRLVDLLEYVEILTDPGEDDSRQRRGSFEKASIAINNKLVSKHQADLPEIVQQQLKQAEFSVKTNGITFAGLVGRMRRFVEAALLVEGEKDPGREAACLVVLDVLRLHLVRARRRIGEAEDIKDLDRRIEAVEEAQTAHKMKQNELVDLGVVGTVYEAICSDPDSELSEAALQLGREMLCLGNRAVQESLMTYAQERDANGLFFKNMRDRLRESKEEISQARKMRKYRKEHHRPPASAYAEALSVMDLLQELCEGHFQPMQELLRTQPFNRKSYDLVAEVAHFLEEMAEDQLTLRYMEDDELKVVIKAFECLVEVMQGPCFSNQKFLADSPAVNCCKTVLSCTTFSRLKNPLLCFEAKAKALLFLASCLEGRTDQFVHTQFSRKLEPSLLNSTVLDLAHALERLENELDEKRYPVKKVAQLQGSANALTDERMSVQQLEEFIFENIDSAALYLFTVRAEMATVPKLSGQLNPPSKYSEDKDYYENYQRLWRRLGSVEVTWLGRIVVLLFPMPAEARSLTGSSKEHFIATANLETVEGRLKSLMDASPVLIDEMKVLDSLKNSKTYSFIKGYYTEIKYINFFLAVLLNFLMLLSLLNPEHDTQIYAHFKTHSVASEVIMITFAVLAMLGHFALVIFFMASEFQLVWKALKRLRREAKKDKEPCTFDSRPIRLWTMTLLGYLVICCVHSVGFGKLDMDFIVSYVGFGAVVLGLSLIRALRLSVIIPISLHTRVLACVYDVVVNPKAALSTGICVLAALGFVQEFFFSFMLLDIITLSEDLKNVVRAVARPIKALVLTGCLFLVVILIFAMIGWSLFGQDHFCEGDCDDDDGELAPTDAMGVFFVILNQGIRYGDIGDIMTGVNHEDSMYFPRISFQLAFFVVIGVLLFDMVTGIILDTFASLREETAFRIDKLLNEGFISGVSRETYDDAGLNFELLNKRDQNVWNYVFFLLYLDLKDENNYSGAENYVSTCVEKGDYSWFPSRTTYALEDLKIQVEEEVDLNKKVDNIQAEVTEMSARFDKLSRSVEHQIEVLTQVVLDKIG